MNAQVVVLVIGDEVLSAKLADENGPFLLRHLGAAGARVRELRILGDDREAICRAVREAMSRGDQVITTGGVGPTHDDVTLSAVAEALGVPLIADERLAKAYRAALRDMPESSVRRLAQVPEGTELFGWPDSFPVLLAGAVVMLPGVPRFARLQFEKVAHLFGAAARVCGALFFDEREDQLAPHLGALLRAHPAVSVGSYPRFDARGFQTIITVEHPDAAEVRAALNWLGGRRPGKLVHREIPFGGLRDTLET